MIELMKALPGAAPTHRCTTCGALWRYWPRRDTGDIVDSWSLRTAHGGPCCCGATEPMKKQIVPLTVDELRAILVGPANQHPDDAAVARFASVMKAKLAKKRAEGRSGWNDRDQCPAERLSSMLRAHVAKGDPVDVGNFAMMLWNRDERISELDQAGFDLVAHLQRQREFSERTFGPGRRTEGVSDHIRKELAEIAQAPGDLEEWVDVILLALDGAWRTGAEPEEIAQAIAAKHAKNERRTWPDWRTVPAGKAIEHE